MFHPLSMKMFHVIINDCSKFVELQFKNKIPPSNIRKIHISSVSLSSVFSSNKFFEIYFDTENLTNYFTFLKNFKNLFEEKTLDSETDEIWIFLIKNEKVVFLSDSYQNRRYQWRQYSSFLQNLILDILNHFQHCC